MFRTVELVFSPFKGMGAKRKKVLCRNSRPLTIACHMKKNVKSDLGEALCFVVVLSFLLLSPLLPRPPKP